MWDLFQWPLLPRLKEYHIISDYCIGCNGPVDSVAIFSDLPLEHASSVILDYQSTNICDARPGYLMKNYWKLDPLMIDADGEDFLQEIHDDVAGLVIGDRALLRKKNLLICMTLGQPGKHIPACLLYLLHGLATSLYHQILFLLLIRPMNWVFHNIDKVISQEKNPPSDLTTLLYRNISVTYLMKKRKMDLQFFYR